jgi:hypothetical protein
MKIILSVVDMFGPTGPKHLEETEEGGGVLADTTTRSIEINSVGFRIFI